MRSAHRGDGVRRCSSARRSAVGRAGARAGHWGARSRPGAPCGRLSSARRGRARPTACSCSRTANTAEASKQISWARRTSKQHAYLGVGLCYRRLSDKRSVSTTCHTASSSIIAQQQQTGLPTVNTWTKAEATQIGPNTAQTTQPRSGSCARRELQTNQNSVSMPDALSTRSLASGSSSRTRSEALPNSIAPTDHIVTGLNPQRGQVP